MYEATVCFSIWWYLILFHLTANNNRILSYCKEKFSRNFDIIFLYFSWRPFKGIHNHSRLSYNGKFTVWACIRFVYLTSSFLIYHGNFIRSRILWLWTFESYYNMIKLTGRITESKVSLCTKTPLSIFLLFTLNRLLYVTLYLIHIRNYP